MAKKGLFSWFHRKDENPEQVEKAGKTSKVSEQNRAEANDLAKKEQAVKQEVVITKEEKTATPKEDLGKVELNKEELSKAKEEPSIKEESLVAKEELKEELKEKVEAKELKEETPKELEPKVEVVKPQDEVAPLEEKIPEPQNKPGFFKRLLKSLRKTRENIGFGLVALFKGRKIDDELFEDIETALITADVGIETTTKIMNKITSEASLRELKDADSLMKRLSEELRVILAPVSEKLVIDTSKKPFVILMVGVNGVGKTTTIGKMAKLFEKEGKKVMLAAGDTFRAAAVEQLKVWGQRNNIPVIAQETGADSASVIFDAITSAKAKGYDVVIADTAGRLQNKAYLMEELKKIVRVMKKVSPDAPHEVMLTLDACTGQNAISQAKLFGEVVPLTGINLTKLDGTAKGGVIFNIASQFKVPIRYIGIGEGIDDLKEFNADDFVNALFSSEE